MENVKLFAIFFSIFVRSHGALRNFKSPCQRRGIAVECDRGFSGKYCQMFSFLTFLFSSLHWLTWWCYPMWALFALLIICVEKAGDLLHRWSVIPMLLLSLMKASVIHKALSKWEEGPDNNKTTSRLMTLHLSWVHCKTSNISHTKSQNLDVSRLVLQLSLSNPLKPGVKSRMKM